MRFLAERNELAEEAAVGPAAPQPSHATATALSSASEEEKQPPGPDGGERGRATSDGEHNVSRVPSRHVEAGVKKIEAVTLTWTKNELVAAYACVFLVFFVISMQQQTQFNLTYYVTSSFAALPLTATTGIVSSIVGGVLRLPTAKFINIIGRAEGFLLMTVITTIGLIMMAACRNVETYAAAQVFYWVGFNGMAFVLDVFLADTSSLKNRALVFAFSTSPYIVTTFIGPRAAQSFLDTSGWPWGFGVYCIVTPLITIPILTLLWRNQRKALRLGLYKKERSGRTVAQAVPYYFWEFDVIGLLLIIAAFVLILLAISLSRFQREGYHAPMIIAMLVVGGVSLVGFALFEKFLCPKPFIPFGLLVDGSVLGACLLIAFLFISFYLWDNFFNNYLQAVHGLSVTDAGYVSNIYSIGSCFWGIVLAGMIRYFGRFKWLCMAHLGLEILGVGLMILLREPQYGIGYVVMTQILIAFGGGGLVICADMAVMAAAPHEGVAPVLALIALFSSVGNGIGSAIATSIYTNKFPAALDRALPGNATRNAELYGSLVVQLASPMGSPERDAVIHAYGESMWYQTIAGTVALVPCFLFIAVWQDFKVKDLRQVKGRVA